MNKSFRYRCYPNPAQEELLRKTIGCARLVYNKALAERSEAWNQRKERIGYNQSSALLTTWKRSQELTFLNEVSCAPLQQSLRHLQTAFNSFWGGWAKYPTFKAKRYGGSATFTKRAFRFKKDRFYLAKCVDPLDIQWSRPLPSGADPTTVTISLSSCNQWHVAFRFDDVRDMRLSPATSSVGLDLGITNLVTLSTGEKVANPRHFEARDKLLKRRHRRLSKTKPGSRNREKAHRKLAKKQRQIANSRRDFLHKLSTRIVRENQTIVVETLTVRGMMKNRSLARQIGRAGWAELLRQLDYKSRWYGRTLVRLSRWYPGSKLCSQCGHRLASLGLGQREWTCPACGIAHDRDVNAARNHLAAGLAVSVCGATVRPDESISWMASVEKQKPRSRVLGIARRRRDEEAKPMRFENR